LRSIDIYAHSHPQSFLRAIESGQDWHGLTADSDEADVDPKEEWTPDPRITELPRENIGGC
jgi:hypothetical protein